jgi:hypothetical protein
MKKVIVVAVIGLFLAVTGSEVFAGWVKGYTRKDGTYVQPHYRSNPDGNKWNNYGPSKSYPDRVNPYGRDNDKDGTPNYLDTDDNNNGVGDDFESNQYKRR